MLTFFMLTTSMVRPQTMEINLPPDKDVKVEISELNLLTLRVDENGQVYAAMGILSPEKVESSNLRAFLRDKRASNPKLVVLLKVDIKCKYSRMVNIMDEFNLTNNDKFSILPLTDQDKAMIAKVRL